MAMAVVNFSAPQPILSGYARLMDDGDKWGFIWQPLGINRDYWEFMGINGTSQIPANPH